MAVFDYVARSSQTDVRGTIAADTPQQARDVLRERGLVVRGMAAHVPSKRRWRWRLPSLGGSVRREEVTALYREIATLLGVGMPMLDVLDTAARTHTGRVRTAVVVLRDRVAGGSGLASAMEEQPAIFDEMALSLASVGEDAGTLEASLERLADFRDRAQQFRNRVATAMIYPAIVALVGIAATLFLMTFVVPGILAPLLEQNIPLPLPTRLVKGTSDFILSEGWTVTIVLGLLAVLAAFILRTAPARSRWRYRWHRLIMRTPILGDLAVKQAVIRLCVVMSMLLKSGIVFVRALQIAQRSSDNLVVREALRQCELAVVAGGDIAAALEKSNTFPPMVVQVFALGQQSGRLEEMLDRLVIAYETQASAAAARLGAVLEPAMIIVLALLILLVVLATVMPILEVGNAIQ